MDNWNKVGDSSDGYLDGTGRRINTFIYNFIIPHLALKSILG